MWSCSGACAERDSNAIRALIIAGAGILPRVTGPFSRRFVRRIGIDRRACVYRSNSTYLVAQSKTDHYLDLLRHSGLNSPFHSSSDSPKSPACRRTRRSSTIGWTWRSTSFNDDLPPDKSVRSRLRMHTCRRTPREIVSESGSYCWDWLYNVPCSPASSPCG
jgi:hypothetical protein